MERKISFEKLQYAFLTFLNIFLIINYAYSVAHCESENVDLGIRGHIKYFNEIIIINKKKKFAICLGKIFTPEICL